MDKNGVPFILPEYKEIPNQGDPVFQCISSEVVKNKLLCNGIACEETRSVHLRLIDFYYNFMKYIEKAREKSKIDGLFKERESLKEQIYETEEESTLN